MATPDPLIVLCDDDFAIASLLTEVLSDEGYSVKWTATSDELMQVINQHQPSLVLTDLSIGRPLGDQLVPALRAMPNMASVPIVLFSASNHLPELSARMGADGYLAKPFELDQMLAMVGRFTTPA